jgi:hypothetical protein
MLKLGYAVLASAYRGKLVRFGSAHREVDEADHATLCEVMCNGSENPIRKER